MNNSKNWDIDNLIDEITLDAANDSEELAAFLTVLQEQMTFPIYASLAGMPVTVSGIEYDGNPLRGIIAICIRRNKQYRVSLFDLDFPDTLHASQYLAACRKWAGLDPSSNRSKQEQKSSDVTGRDPADLLVFAVKKKAASCRWLYAGEEVTVRLSSFDLLSIIPGEIVTISPRKIWYYGNHRYMSGKLLAHHIDIPAFNLVPLKLEGRGDWEPKEHYPDELSEIHEDDIGDYLKPIIAAGKRPCFEMEQVVPGDTDPDADGPIMEAVYCIESGDAIAARKILMELLTEDLRCLDAHAHMGNISFDTRPEKAILHFQVGVQIGELSLPDNFKGALLWGLIDNRPFLRCLQGYGLCLWRLERFTEAEQVFKRILWFNPMDNQGVRFLIDDVHAKKPWKKD